MAKFNLPPGPIFVNMLYYTVNRVIGCFFSKFVVCDLCLFPPFQCQTHVYRVTYGAYSFCLFDERLILWIDNRVNIDWVCDAISMNTAFRILFSAIASVLCERTAVLRMDQVSERKKLVGRQSQRTHGLSSAPSRETRLINGDKMIWGNGQCFAHYEKLFISITTLDFL